MCGIFAYYNIREHRVPGSVARGLRSLTHRGPDSEGQYTREGLFLGHTRLKIIDLSDDANQPMRSRSGRYYILFNGEIYNYKELRRRLESEGCQLKTQSDTEVLLSMYENYGPKCLDSLNGMFAFVIYDEKTQELFAARDRLGIKPLYYAWDGNVLAFASEIRALISSNVISRELDMTAVRAFLQFGSVQSPRTIIKGIRHLMPGSYLTFSNGRVETHRYWQSPFVPEEEKRSESFDDARSGVRELLEDSVRLRLVSDVPLGAFLSGGVDSSTIVALMSKVGVKDIKTFSIGFDVGGSAYNETHYASIVAQQFRTDHHEVTLTGEDVAKEIPGYIHFLDEPSWDGLNSYCISKFARRYVTVCLSGLGGDEVFGGYSWVAFLHFVSRFGLNALGERSRTRIETLYEHLDRRLRRNKALRTALAMIGTWPKPMDIYNHFRYYFIAAELAQLLPDYYGMDDADAGAYSETLDNLSAIDAGCKADQELYLRNTLLRDADVMSMAHSLELRVPFLDHRLVEYVARLPSSVKAKLGRSKFLLKEAFKEDLPEDLFGRRKMGFSFPLGIWLRMNPLRDTLRDCFSDYGLKRRAFFDSRSLDSLLKRGLTEDPSRRSGVGSQLWMLVVLELWLRDAIDSAPVFH